jgi:hypothetical protein
VEQGAVAVVLLDLVVLAVLVVFLILAPRAAAADQVQLLLQLALQAKWQVLRVQAKAVMVVHLLDKLLVVEVLVALMQTDKCR